MGTLVFMDSTSNTTATPSADFAQWRPFTVGLKDLPPALQTAGFGLGGRSEKYYSAAAPKKIRFTLLFLKLKINPP